MVVSVHPCKVEASRPTKESGPKFLKISFIIAREAVPEIGLTKAIGNISIGRFNRLKKGSKSLKKASKIPLFKKI